MPNNTRLSSRESTHLSSSESHASALHETLALAAGAGVEAAVVPPGAGSAAATSSATLAAPSELRRACGTSPAAATRSSLGCYLHAGATSLRPPLPHRVVHPFQEYRFGPEKAGGLDTYKVQMGGFNASLKGSGKIPNRKVQQHIIDYTQAMNEEHGEGNWEESDELDGNVVYKTFDGLKHGHFAMGNGSFKKAEVLGAVKLKKARFSGTSYQEMQRKNEELHHQIASLEARDEQRKVVILEQQQRINQQQEYLKQQQELMKVVQNIGLTIPPNIIASWESQHTRTSGSNNTNPSDGDQEDTEDACI